MDHEFEGDSANAIRLDRESDEHLRAELAAMGRAIADSTRAAMLQFSDELGALMEESRENFHRSMVETFSGSGRTELSALLPGGPAAAGGGCVWGTSRQTCP